MLKMTQLVSNSMRVLHPDLDHNCAIFFAEIRFFRQIFFIGFPPVHFKQKLTFYAAKVYFWGLKLGVIAK